MSDLTLTDERRAELVALMDDDERFRAEYPKVAEYLAMSPRLAGTPDATADAAFDLRLLHFMTDRIGTGNPYWDIVRPSVTKREGRRVVDGGSLDGSVRLGYAEMLLQATFAYAIPSPETLSWLAALCAGRRLVEQGAGRGYWAAQLANAGVDVVAYDIEPPAQTDNLSFPTAAGQPDEWFDVGSPDEWAVESYSSSDVLFLCWPPGWGNTMASNTLATFTESGATSVVYIGEPRGGKTGDTAFFDELDSDRWQLVSTDQSFVSWWNVIDAAEHWERIRS